tara:strand:+ start:282 stop:785 length:504 start_codon:yes stop_codon:yes gene_type:complete
MTSTLKTDKIEGVTASGTVQMPAGHVVQVVEKVSTASATFTANSYADHDELAITPKFSTSKMYLSFTGRVKYGNQLGNQERARGGFKWNRFVGGSSVASHNHSTEQFQSNGVSNNGSLEFAFTVTYAVFDTPSTSSEITYKLQVINSQTDNDFSVSHGQITIMEIAQ